MTLMFLCSPLGPIKHETLRMFGIVNQLKSLSLRPVRSLSISAPVSNRLEKRWTERRTKRRQLTRLWKQNTEYFEEKWHQNYSKEVDRKKEFVAKLDFVLFHR